MLDTVHQLLMTTLNQLDNEAFMNVEVALRFFYMMGEVLPDKVMTSCIGLCANNNSCYCC